MPNPELVIPATDFNPSRRHPDTFLEASPNIIRLAADKLAQVLSTQAYVDMVDISHWNYGEGKEPDFKILYENGFLGVILKSTESDWFLDDKFDIGWRSAIENGMIPLTYHFFRDHVGGFEQAQWNLSKTVEYMKAVNGKTIVFNDAEVSSLYATQSQRQNRCKAFNETIEEEGFQSGLYSSKYLWESLMGKIALPWVSKYWQWPAHWTSAAEPLLPVGWTREKAKFWQYGISPTHSWARKVGTDGNVDVDRFYGTLQDLKNLLGITPPMPSDCCEKLEQELKSVWTSIAVMSGKINGHDVSIDQLSNNFTGLNQQYLLLAGELNKLKAQITYQGENQGAMQTQLDLVFQVMGDIKKILP